MGKDKTQSTEQLRQFGKKLVAQGMVVLGKDVILEVNPFIVPEGVEVKEVEGGLSEKALPPKGAGVLKS